MTQNYTFDPVLIQVWCQLDCQFDDTNFTVRQVYMAWEKKKMIETVRTSSILSEHQL